MKKSTELCVNLKTYLNHDPRPQTGKKYRGTLTLDPTAADFNVEDYHYSFVESEAQCSLPQSRHPRVYAGKYVTLTRRPDGTVQPHFRTLRHDTPGFDLDRYTLDVFSELSAALHDCLVMKAR